MYLLSSIPHMVTLIAPPFSNVFMRINIWVPFIVACGILLSTFLVIWLMPESLKLSPCQDLPYDAQASEGGSRNIPENESLLQDRTAVSEENHSSWTRIPRDIIALFRVSNIPFIFFAFLAKPIALISKAYTFQHASESFGWKLAQTTWLRFSQAAGSVVITMLFLPILSAMLIRKGFHPKKLDLGVIRWSVGIAVIGFGMLWLANASWLLVVGEIPRSLFVNPMLIDPPGLFICGLSEGLEPALQGLATASITKAYAARLFTTLAVIETIGRLIGGPLMARLFSLGRSQGQGSKGINFLTASVIFAFLEVCSWTAKVK